ncbi:hypothetical protein E2C01_042086 [Portunus trituberculatus]|uniref:Uncharacterized protein n=1 Tax=Portunus trituberculatus TaxID=210409 RepID=A0A5B7FSR1_PORTR|nr:hypothetical protein [Portunus trituberculatus]
MNGLSSPPLPAQPHPVPPRPLQPGLYCTVHCREPFFPLFFRRRVYLAVEKFAVQLRVCSRQFANQKQRQFSFALLPESLRLFSLPLRSGGKNNARDYLWLHP